MIWLSTLSRNIDRKMNTIARLLNGHTIKDILILIIDDYVIVDDLSEALKVRLPRVVAGTLAMTG